MTLQLLLADDQNLMRQGLRCLLEGQPDFEVVAECCSGTEAVEATRQQKPDIAIIDVGIKELNGITATCEILKQSPQTNVLILSMHCDERYLPAAVKAGANGYMLKSSSGDELIRAIRAVHDGSAFFRSARRCRQYRTQRIRRPSG